MTTSNNFFATLAALVVYQSICSHYAEQTTSPDDIEPLQEKRRPQEFIDELIELQSAVRDYTDKVSAQRIQLNQLRRRVASATTAERRHRLELKLVGNQLDERRRQLTDVEEKTRDRTAELFRLIAELAELERLTRYEKNQRVIASDDLARLRAEIGDVERLKQQIRETSDCQRKLDDAVAERVTVQGALATYRLENHILRTATALAILVSMAAVVGLLMLYQAAYGVEYSGRGGRSRFTRTRSIRIIQRLNRLNRIYTR